MDKQHLYHALDNLAEQNNPDNIDLTAAIQSHFRQQQSARMSRIVSLPYPLRLVSGLLLCFCVAATTVYAVVQLRIQDPGLDESMITPINLSQTVGAMTFTIDWAYADANRIALGYSLSHDRGNTAIPNHWLTNVELIATDSEGRRYQPIGAFGIDRSIPEMLSTDAHFDASIIENGTDEDAPKELNLHLKVRDTFEFDFTVPFTGGVRVENGKKVEFENLTASIEWVVISPSMTHLYFCYEMPEGGPWYPNVKLAYDGEAVALEPGASYFQSPQSQGNGTWCREDRFMTTYRELPETLTLTINHLQTPTYYSEENMQRASEVLEKYGVESEILKNPASDRESYLLSIPNPPDDAELWNRIWKEAIASIGEPLEGERIDGPWVLTIDVP
jgi:hypothetical protein